MPNPARTRVLIVDDDEDMLDSLVMALEDEFEVVTAANGREALARIASQPVDVVLLDLRMPVLDGEGYMKEHALHHPGVPVLLLSADLDLRHRAAALGARDHLHKPFSLTTLEAKLRRLASGGGSSSGPSPSGAPKPAGNKPDGGPQFTTMSLMTWTFSPAG